MHKLISHSLIFLTFLSCSQMALIQKKPIETFWLKTSLYSFPFYDHHDLRLLDARPNFANDDLKTMDGFTINPKTYDLIVPIGTLVQILDISYPNFTSKLNRPIYSPKNRVWVYAKVARERGQVTVFHDKIHVLVLPANIKNESQVKDYLAKFFSKLDPNPWLISQSKYIIEGILKKEPKIGMEKQHVLATLGEPLKKSSNKDPQLNYNEDSWEYPHYLLVFTKERLIKINKIAL